jgi:ribosomal protein S27AE
MAEETTQRVKRGRTFDSAYGFSFSIAVGLVLFIAGLVISLTLSDGTSIGLIFGIPLLVAGLVVPVFMMRDLFKTNEINAPCPNCGAPIRTSDATLRLKCTHCHSTIDVREKELILAPDQLT